MRNSLQIGLLFVLAILGGGAFLGYHFSQRIPTWERLDSAIAEHFPDLPSISVEALDQWLADSNRPRPLILDARSREEYAISFIADARLVGTGPEAAASLSDEDLKRPIVVYAAADPRAAPVVRDLIARGAETRHLTHGIFAWANAGLPLFDADGPTTGVHRMDATNQTLLNEDLRRRPEAK